VQRGCRDHGRAQRGPAMAASVMGTLTLAPAENMGGTLLSLGRQQSAPQVACALPPCGKLSAIMESAAAATTTGEVRRGAGHDELSPLWRRSRGLAEWRATYRNVRRIYRILDLTGHVIHIIASNRLFRA
jgi:hypothetical protein